MPRYTDESKERVRDAADFAAVVSARTELRRAGQNRLTGLCPFHDERTPSFGIDPVAKVYHCFGCGASGDIFTFVQETEGVDFPGALEVLADRFGVPLEVVDEDPRAAERRRRKERMLELLERTATYYQRYLWDAEEASGAREYLASRGLAEESLRSFRVGYASSRWDRILLASRRAGFSEAELLAVGLAQRSSKSGQLYDRFRARIMFPICDTRGRVLGFGGRATREDQGAKYVNTAEGELFHKGKVLYGAHLARAAAAKAGVVIAVEGYTDVIALHHAGVANSVGIMGTSVTEDQIGELGRLAGADGSAILALDADAAGAKGMLRAEDVARRRKLRLSIAPLPPGVDPAELVSREGADAARALVERAVPFARFQVDRVLETSNLTTAAGKDDALEALRPVLGALPQSKLREEIVQRVASRLELGTDLLANLIARPPAPRGGEARRGVALDRREQTERTFLALCVAVPDRGREALRRVSLDDHFTTELHRRAAVYVRDHASEPLAHLPPGDEELASLVAELTVRAARGPDDEAALEVETLQLEKARLERAMAAARDAGSLDVPELAAQRGRVQRELDRWLERASGGTPGS